MRKQIAFVLAVALLSALFLPASADGIAEGPGGKLEITEIKKGYSGGLRIIWNDPNSNAPYKVLFQPVSSQNEHSPSGAMILWCNSGPVSETEYLEHYVVPDYSWWFIVEDSAGNQAVRKYGAEEKSASVRDYSPLTSGSDYEFARCFDVGISPQKRTTKGGVSDYTDLDGKKPKYSASLDQEEILSAADDTVYGIRVTYSCRDLPAVAGETLVMKYVLDNPQSENFPVVISYSASNDPGGQFMFSSRYDTISTFVSLTPFVRQMNRILGSAKGTYALRIYVNGEHAWTLNLSVR